MITITVALTAATLLASEPRVASQSFDCAKAQTRVEKMICSDADLRELDEHLGRYYAAGRAAVEGASACLQSDQAQWLKTIRNQCADASCLKAAYLDRLGELDGLQPGATAIKNITLPNVPSLVWIIAPASDTVAAPSNPKAKPFEATGTIVNEVTGGDGFMLVTPSGQKVPLVLLMFLEGNTPPAPGGVGEGQECHVPRPRVRGAGPFAHVLRAEPLHVHLPDAGGGSGGTAVPPNTAVPPDRGMEKVRTRVVTHGKVCPDPNRPCDGFKPTSCRSRLRSLSRSIAAAIGRSRSSPSS